MQLELISTRRCPFVQRSIIMLNHKGIAHKMTFIDLDDPPDWFREISPFGKVPLLRVDDAAVIFESAVINEYLDDITPGQLQPQDPLQRALNKSWIEFGGSCNSLTFQLMVAPDQASFENHVAELKSNLARVDKAFGNGPFFNGEKFALIDAAYAPLFIRLDILRDLLGLAVTDDLAKIDAWSKVLLALPEVQKARVPELPDLFRQLIRSRDAYAQARLSEA